ncbi:MAG: multifunctional CCA addition/repair protein [Gammaproteobacteria bacterium]|nr:multifunctional CCA addition/repair protein [Gammaproteobacteria bacterium]
MKTYLVGGAIRDELLNLPFSEKDWVVVGSSPEAMGSAGFKPVGKDFPVFLHPETKEEYALARTERKTAPGYKGFSFHTGGDVTLEDDLLRRDLTINAIAKDEQGSLVDPYNGQRDLELRVLRHVSPAFAEDPVRILRVARFAAKLGPLGFRVAPETLELMKQMVDAGEADHLVPERVWQETAKALQMPAPQRFVEILRNCGALAKIYPEIDAMFGVPQKPQWHPEIDCGRHLLMCLEISTQITSDLRTRFAVLTHDLGKGATPDDILPSHHGHEERGVPLVEQLCTRVRPPKDFQRLAVKVSRWHLHSHRLFELKDTTVLKLLEGLDAFRTPEDVIAFSYACEADARGRERFMDSEYPQAAATRALLEAVAPIRLNDDEKEGLQGKEFAEALRRKRLQGIRDFFSNYPTPKPRQAS